MRKKNIWVIEDTSFPFIIKFIFIILSRLANSRIVYTSKKVKKVYLNNFLLKKNFKKEIFAPVDLSFFYNKNKKKK